jgi:hypothetical protein
MPRAFPTLAIALTLGGCGPALGRYDLVNVKLVDSAALDGAAPSELGVRQLIRIEFVSPTNLEKLDGVTAGNLYVFADFCPYRSGGFMLFGPYNGNMSRLGAEPGGEKAPVWDPARKAYVYTAYLEPHVQARPAIKPGQIEIKVYDLRTDTRDLCLRIKQAGYFLTASQSRVIVVPRAQIARALALSK